MRDWADIVTFRLRMKPARRQRGGMIRRARKAARPSTRQWSPSTQGIRRCKPPPREGHLPSRRHDARVRRHQQLRKVAWPTRRLSRRRPSAAGFRISLGMHRHKLPRYGRENAKGPRQQSLVRKLDRAYITPREIATSGMKILASQSQRHAVLKPCRHQRGFGETETRSEAALTTRYVRKISWSF